MASFVAPLRAYLADNIRAWRRAALWLAELISVAADVVDPLRPETIRHPRRWAGRVIPALAHSFPDDRSGPPKL